ncbi:MAG: SH3 domain-containing protein [Clostridia bacterium]|nr:SH3 domain-containing protein [Clostridia bacterium]
MTNLKKAICTFLITINLLIFISTWSSATQTATVNKDANLRKTTSNTSTILEIIPKNEKVEIVEKDGEWYKVIYARIRGYVKASDLKIEEDTNKDTTKDNQNTVNATNTQNVVQNPTTNITQEPENNVVEATNTIQQAVEEEQIINELKTGDTVTIQQDEEIYIRPLINSNTINTLSAKKQITIIQIVNDWVYISTDISNGWIRQEKLSKIDPETTIQQEAPKEEPKQTNLNKTAYINSDDINLRKEASTDSKVLKVLMKNDKITIIEEQDEFYKVKYNEQEGYVAKKFITDKKIEVTSRSETQRKTTDIETKPKEDTAKDESKVVTTSNKGQQIVEYAKQYLGYKYVYGGETPKKGFDCSGLTKYVLKNFGVNLPHSATAQYSIGTKIQKSQLQVGDIVFFSDFRTYKGIGHCGIYIGNNQFIHASTEKTGVIISSLQKGSYVNRYVGATRVI